MIVLTSYAWFRSLKWGRNAPGAVLWWTCSPFGQFVIVDEYKFQYADPSEVVAAVKDRDRALGMTSAPRYCAAEPKIWSVERGPTTAELFARAGMPLMKSAGDDISSRIQGWNQMAALMKSTVTVGETLQPALVVAARCTQLKRSLPLLRQGKTNPEDIEAGSDSALVEALRIGVMSRPQAQTLQTVGPTAGMMGHALELARQNYDNPPDDLSGYVPT